MRSGEKRLTQQQILFVSFFVSTVMLFISIILPRLIPPNSVENSISPTPNNSLAQTQIPAILSPTVLKPSDTPIVISTPTALSNLLTPIIGISGLNLPDGFRVGPWHDNFDICQSDTTSVMIIGVEISGGFPPYQFSFRQYETGLNVFFKTRPPLESDYVQFDEPVVVTKNAYVHVEIRFEGEDGISFWIDDLYYPNIMDSSICPKP